MPFLKAYRHEIPYSTHFHRLQNVRLLLHKTLIDFLLNEIVVVYYPQYNIKEHLHTESADR